MPTKKPIVKRPPKTLKERRFVKEYIANGGNGMKAALKVYDSTDGNTAAVIASQNLKKLNIVDLMEKHGVTDDLLMDGLKEGLQAYKRSTSLTEPDSIDPDFSVRHKYWTSASTLKGWLNSNSGVTQNIQNNIHTDNANFGF